MDSNSQKQRTRSTKYASWPEAFLKSLTKTTQTPSPQFRNRRRYASSSHMQPAINSTLTTSTLKPPSSSLISTKQSTLNNPTDTQTPNTHQTTSFYYSTKHYTA